MIYTVTLNPAIDYTLSPGRFVPGTINSAESCFYGPGGKGVNVSLLLTGLEVENTALGIAAGFSGREIVRLLDEAGCKTEFLFLREGHSRINLKIRSPGGEETDVNGLGPCVPPEAVEQLAEKLELLAPGDSLVLAGSVPPSLPKEIYGQLLSRLEGKEILTVTDAAGAALLAALPCHPFLIKPNLEELEEIFGFPVTDVPTAVQCGRELQQKGARQVVVSMGSEGALLVPEQGEALFCRAPRGETVSTVGAGDSLVAGFLYGWKLSGTGAEALRWGVAAGSATAFSPGIAAGSAVREMYLSAGKAERAEG